MFSGFALEHFTPDSQILKMTYIKYYKTHKHYKETSYKLRTPERGACSAERNNGGPFIGRLEIQAEPGMSSEHL